MRQARRSENLRNQDPCKGSFAARSTLLPLTIADNLDIINALKDTELARWLVALPVPVDLETCEKYLGYLHEADVCAKTLRVNGKFAGVVSFASELSFWIRTDFHRKGLGSWAVGQFLEQLPDKSRPVSTCSTVDNVGAASMLQKIGFVRVGSPFKRFSFAHGHAVQLLRFKYLYY